MLKTTMIAAFVTVIGAATPLLADEDGKDYQHSEEAQEFIHGAPAVAS